MAYSLAASQRHPVAELRNLRSEIWLLPLLALLVLAIGGLKLEYLLAATGAITALALTLTRPVWVLYLLLLSVPFASLAEIDAGDFTISATEGLVGLLALSWLLPAATRRDVRLEGGPLLFALLWVLGIMLLTMPGAPKLSLAMKETIKWLELVLVFVFVTQHVKDWITTQRVLAVLLLAGVAESVYALVMLVLGEGPSSFAVGDVVRASGTFDQPNPFAGYLGTLLPLGVALALSMRARIAKAAAWAGVLIVLAGFLASQSRGAWLGLTVAALVVLLTWSPRSRASLLPIGYFTAIAAALAGLGLVPQAIVGRMGVILDYFGLFDVREVPVTPENFSVVERMAHWQAGLYMFQDHPIFGVGPGNYPAVYERYYLPGWVEALGHAHNYYLNTAAEIGLVGLVGLIAVLVIAFRLSAEALRLATADRPARPEPVEGPPTAGGRRPLTATAAIARSTRRPLVLSLSKDAASPLPRPLAAALLASLVVFALHNLFDNLLVHGMSVQVGLLLGLVYVAARRHA